MQILAEKVELSDLKSLAEKMFGNLLKGVVDVEREAVAIDGELHSDLAERLAEDGSKGMNLWGFNVYPEESGADWLEFDSVINIKPLANNRTRGIEDEEVRMRAKAIIERFIVR